MSETTMNVFFYGLFMDESLLASKGVHPINSKVAYVDGYRLHIGERATLLPEPKARAYGVMMEITSKDATRLYSEQSVADYVAEPVTVNLSDDLEVPAVSYNLSAARLSGTNPEYAASLLVLATRLALPASYLAHIRKIAEGTGREQD